MYPLAKVKKLYCHADAINILCNALKALSPGYGFRVQACLTPLFLIILVFRSVWIKGIKFMHGSIDVF